MRASAAEYQVAYNRDIVANPEFSTTVRAGGGRYNQVRRGVFVVSASVRTIITNCSIYHNR
ncbi:MAG: hypothetical protein DHS20C01_08110 [marine bacterium B5-7]|nr:MAG: hypothetical protein DHS20C01_08110 [marine bacterium B5-7]